MTNWISRGGWKW